MPAGNLTITVVSGRDLRKTQLVGWQDPYVVIDVGSTQLKTKRDKDGNKNPKWGQKFEISIGPDVNEARFSVWNDNRVQENSLIGTGRLSLNTAFTQRYHDARLELTTHDGKSAGELMLVVTYEPVVHVPSAPTMTAGFSHAPVTGQGGELMVSVLKGCGLKNVETVGQRQDPYCVLQIGSTKFQTRTVTDGGKNPKFDERFTFSIGPQDMQLTVEMWDANVIKTNKIIGCGRVSLSEVVCKQFHEARVMLMDQKNISAGELELFLQFKPFGGVPQAPAPVISQPAPQVLPQALQQPVAHVVQQAPIAVQQPAPQVVVHPQPAALQQPAPQVVVQQAPIAVQQPAPQVVVQQQPVAYYHHPVSQAMPQAMPPPVSAPQPVAVPQPLPQSHLPAQQPYQPMAVPAHGPHCPPQAMHPPPMMHQQQAPPPLPMAHAVPPAMPQVVPTQLPAQPPPERHPFSHMSASFSSTTGTPSFAHTDSMSSVLSYSTQGSFSVPPSGPFAVGNNQSMYHDAQYPVVPPTYSHTDSFTRPFGHSASMVGSPYDPPSF